MREVCAEIRKEVVQQEFDQIEAAKKSGVEFITLPDGDMNTLRKKSVPVLDKYTPEINKLYPGDKYRPASYLEEVKGFIGYKP